MDRALDDMIITTGRGGRRVGVRGRNPTTGGFRRRIGGGGGGSGSPSFGSYQHDDRGSRGDDRGAGGAIRRSRATSRVTVPYSRSGSIDTVWKHDLYKKAGQEEGEEEAPRRQQGGLETGAKLQIDNLAFSVTSEDLRDLFEPFGELRRAAVHFDKSGRSLGRGTALFARRADALAALRKYNNVPLDNSPMKITLASRATERSDDGGGFVRSAVREALVVSVGGPRTRRITTLNRVRTRKITRIGGGINRPVSRRSGFGSRKKAPTAEELDAELDAMQQTS